jgi:hypothetical protein
VEGERVGKTEGGLEGLEDGYLDGGVFWLFDDELLGLAEGLLLGVLRLVGNTLGLFVGDTVEDTPPIV